MPAQSSDKFIVNRAGVSYQALYSDLVQDISTDVTIGTADADGGQITVQRAANSNLPHLILRRESSDTQDFKMVSFLLDGDDGEEVNLYANANISLKTNTAPSTTDTSASQNVLLQVTAPGGIVLGSGNAERFRIDAAGRIGIGTSTPVAPLHAQISDTNSQYVLGTEVSALFEVNGDNKVVIQSSESGASSVAFGDRSDYDTGLVTYNNATNQMTITTNNSVRVTIKDDGTVNFGSISTYANNADAITGGLATGDLYRTTDGSLKIVF